MDFMQRFRLSTYLTLGLATLCLGYAAHEQIKGAGTYYAGPILLAFFASYLTEGRWRLPNWGANVLAVVLVVGWPAWVFFTQSSSVAIEDYSDIIRLIVPFGGPLFALLALAILLRPKRVTEYWFLHGLGLGQMALASFLAMLSRQDREDPLFITLLVGYLLSGLWSLQLFYLYREAVADAAAEAGPAPALVGVPGWGRTLGWFAAAAGLGLGVFVGVPRPAQEGASVLVLPGIPRAQTGFSPSMDLNHQGPIEVSDALVMRVRATDAAGQPRQLDAETRWRGITCSNYEKGQWKQRFTNPDERMAMVEAAGPLQPRGDHLVVEYQVNLGLLAETSQTQQMPRGLAGPRVLFLAEPLTLFRSNPYTQPRVHLVGGFQDFSHNALKYRRLEPLLQLQLSKAAGTLKYQQIHLPSHGGRDWSQPDDVGALGADRADNPERHLSYPALLQTLDPIPGQEELVALAEKILHDARLPTRATFPKHAPEGEADLRLREQQARALEHFLLSSNDYSYSLDHRRTDPTIDPTVDFLCRGKTGHCQLFASALALMLRSQGIPARVVIGFRGSDWVGGADIHEVRQYHAHAWVEALIGPRNAAGVIRTGRWLTLDPTPGGGTVGQVAPADQRGFFEEELHLVRYLWEAVVLDYTGDVRPEQWLARARQALDPRRFQAWVEEAPPAAWAIGLGGGVLAVLAGRWAWRRRRGRLTARGRLAIPFYARLVALLGRLGLRPRPDQTAAEFAAAAGRTLGQRPATAPVAAVPAAVADTYYGVRFGGRPLDPAAAAVEADLARLEQAVR